MWSIAASPTPAVMQISDTPCMKARDGSSGVLATLCVKVRLASVSVNTMSVNVPPTSTPISSMPPVYADLNLASTSFSIAARPRLQ